MAAHREDVEHGGVEEDAHSELRAREHLRRALRHQCGHGRGGAEGEGRQTEQTDPRVHAQVLPQSGALARHVQRVL
eukprot:1194835-Prorocentrum_minimum.AAC.4